MPPRWRYSGNVKNLLLLQAAADVSSIHDVYNLSNKINVRRVVHRVGFLHSYSQRSGAAVLLRYASAALAESGSQGSDSHGWCKRVQEAR